MPRPQSLFGFRTPIGKPTGHAFTALFPAKVAKLDGSHAGQSQLRLAAYGMTACAWLEFVLSSELESTAVVT